VRHRRDATRVIRDILALAADGHTKTGIVYRANLNFKLADTYLEFLLSKKYMTNSGYVDDPTRFYELTHDGRRLLLLLETVENELEDLFITGHRSVPALHPSNIRILERSEERE
jgi:predicted transcriptional regulator